MLLKHILALIAFVPFVMSHQCHSNQFWWDGKGCCLPTGGPPNPPSPPPNTNCPSTHYWYKPKHCCAPRNPPTGPPKCPTDWKWDTKQFKCKPRPTPPSPPKNKPSPKPGHYYNGDNDHGHHKRSSINRPIRCPHEFTACPVTGLTGDFECVDTTNELESCGGCVTLGQGQDCTKIAGAWNIGCERGSCRVYTCEGGYRLDANNNTCVLL